MWLVGRPFCHRSCHWAAPTPSNASHGRKLLQWQVLEGKQRGWEAVDPSPLLMITRNGMPVTAWAPWEFSKLQIPCAKHSATGLSRKTQLKIQALFPLFSRIVLLPFYHSVLPLMTAFHQNWSHALARLQRHCGMRPLRRGDGGIKLVGAGDVYGFSPDGDMRAFITFLLLAPSESAWRGSMLAESQLHPKICSPTILGNLSCWVWSRAEPQCSPPPS